MTHAVGPIGLFPPWGRLGPYGTRVSVALSWYKRPGTWEAARGVIGWGFPRVWIASHSRRCWWRTVCLQMGDCSVLHLQHRVCTLLRRCPFLCCVAITLSLFTNQEVKVDLWLQAVVEVARKYKKKAPEV